MENLKKIEKAFKVSLDGFFSTIEPVETNQTIDNQHQYFKTMAKAKKYVLNYLNWTLSEYKNNIKEIKNLK